MTLREGAVEAMAAAFNKNMLTFEPEVPISDAMLDALLDYLTENVAVPMMQSSVLAREWVVCKPEDADAFVVDVAVLRVVEEDA